MDDSNRAEDDPVSVPDNVVGATQNDVDSGAPLLPPHQMHLLKLGLGRMANIRRFRCLKRPLSATDDAVATVGLSGILKKFDSYKEAEEFLADIETLVMSYSAQFTGDANIKKAAESLTEIARRQITCIKKCAECFEYWANDVADFFSRVCTKPHLIVYAKMDGYPHWPSKVLAINDNMVNVEFFGDHTQADVPLTHCFLYSEEFNASNSKNRSFKKALEELNLHIGKIKEKFGAFIPAQFKVGLSSENADKQLMEMIPGVFDPKHKLVSKPHTSKSGGAGKASCESGGTSHTKVASPDTNSSGTNYRKRPDEEQIRPKKRVRLAGITDSSHAENNGTEMAQNDNEQPSVPATYSAAPSDANLTKAQIEEMAGELQALEDDRKQFELQLEKLKELKTKTKNQIKLCEQGIWDLRHQIAMSGNALTCATCATISTGLFYCNDDCRTQK